MPRVSGKKYCDSPKAVGKRLKRMREMAGVSQRQLAFPGCTAAYISRIEQGARMPTLQMLNQLAEALGFPTSYLAWGWRVPHNIRERAIWILEVFGDATDDELKLIKMYNLPAMQHVRMKWLIETLMIRDRAKLAVNAKTVYSYRFKGGRQ